ncbi:MAG: TerB family tellurite resistance protein [Candidatus Niameybacter stercoravium]|nr:TerB family tellurite resistance protein [Candidatus Niameybacter stercoravium]
MSYLFGLIQSIFSFGFTLITMIFTIILAFVIAGIAAFKGRNPLFWGILGFFFPWIIFIMPFIPRKVPKFTGDLRYHEAFRGKNPVVASIMALSAIVAKSDGNISRDEIKVVKQFVVKTFGLSYEALNSYAGAFEYGKNHPEDYKEFTRMITSYYNRRDILVAIAYLLVKITMQDGTSMSAAEDEQVRSILAELGISMYEYESIKASFRQERYNYDYSNYGQHGYNQSNSSGFRTQGAQSLTKKYADVLGVDENASLSEIKKAYRKLVKEYHPDKMAAESMPKEYADFANQKIIEINEAYEYLKNLRENG